MEMLIITGMSGAGKSTALKILEDSGYLCIDNFPVMLLEKFSELSFSGNTNEQKIALCMDVRSGKEIDKLPGILDRISASGRQIRVLFLDADDSALIMRYKETRRNHPLSPGGRVEEGIRLERERIEPLKNRADYIIDTSRMLTRDLMMRLSDIFLNKGKYFGLNVNIVSFGFKYGIPEDADMVFDVRFLPNPYYIPALKKFTGLDDDVHNYVMGFKEAGIFLDKVEDMMKFLLPHYVEEGKHQIVIAIGCTGGKHRSVTLAMELANRLSEIEGYGVTLEHIHIDRDAKRGK